VTDRHGQTDRRTQRDSIYRASIASRGKKYFGETVLRPCVPRPGVTVPLLVTPVSVSRLLSARQTPDNLQDRIYSKRGPCSEKMWGPLIYEYPVTPHCLHQAETDNDDDVTNDVELTGVQVSKL